ncbi:MAG: O-antigen ligase family protein [Bacteroidetes bacterium]|nr:O-antigen ligase family protein [Bacteroidota bacterium]
MIEKIEKYRYYIIYGISILFILFNCYLIAHERFWGLLTPLVIIMVLLYIFSLDKIILLITFLTPLAVNYKNYELGVGISLPTEPLMAGVLVVFVLRIFLDGGYNRKILNHPVTIAILANLVWLFITIITSELPVVSIKFMLARLWFIVPFYFIGIVIFSKMKNIRLFQWLYVIPLLLVIFYALYNHSLYGFDKPSSNMVMKPFYNDHTAYGAILAMFIPIFLGFSVSKLFTARYRFFSLAVLVIMILGIIFSYSRAAWISVAMGGVAFLLIHFRVKFKYVLTAVIVMAGLFYMFQFQLIDKLEKNKQDSSTDFFEHIQSISNISSDASNLERINRWSCAIRLFKERPFLGWGPGTYQFVYAPFQRSKEKTIISTNAGDMGNAHSEYIGPLSESGILGMLTFIAIMITVVYTGLRVYKYARNPESKFFAMVLVVAMITYFTHGLLNNFLDTDKASVPFWGFIGIIVALDLFLKDKSPEELEKDSAAEKGGKE